MTRLLNAVEKLPEIDYTKRYLNRRSKKVLSEGEKKRSFCRRVDIKPVCLTYAIQKEWIKCLQYRCKGLPGVKKRKSKRKILYNKIDNNFLPEMKSSHFILPAVSIVESRDLLLLKNRESKTANGEIKHLQEMT